MDCFIKGTSNPRLPISKKMYPMYIVRWARLSPQLQGLFGKKLTDKYPEEGWEYIFRAAPSTVDLSALEGTSAQRAANTKRSMAAAKKAAAKASQGVYKKPAANRSL